MLVVHPASYCDVCLDPYNITSEPTNSPHAIACGHIFCLTCLRNLTPSICPLCRKTFQQGSVKKLHLAVPPELDGASESPENAQASSLLQRVALVSGEDVPDAEVVAVLTEVDEWLSQHSDDANSNQPLRAAVASLQRYKALLDQTERDKVEHRRLRHQLKSSRRNADHDLKTSRAVEESLLSRIQELESEYALELSRLQAQINTLQNTRIQHRNTSNPLPSPPEPLPPDRLPPFLRPGGSASGHDLLNSASYPSALGNGLPNGTSSAPSVHPGSSYTHVQIAQPVATRPHRREAPLDGRRSKEPSALDNHDAGHQQHRRSRSGSARVEFVDPPVIEPRQTNNGASRGSTVRGASPSTRGIISSPSWSHHPVVEERRSDEERDTHRRRRSDAAATSRRSVGGENAAQEVGVRLSSAASYIQGYGAGYDSGHRIASEPRSYTPSGQGVEYHQGARGFPVHESPDTGVCGLGLVGVPPRGPTGTVITSDDDHDTTPVNRTAALNRRHAIQGVRAERSAEGLGNDGLLDMRFDGADHRFHGQLTDQVLYAGRGGSAAPNGTNGTDLAARRRAGPPPAIAVPVAGEDESPGSEATWGTVPTGSLTGSSLSDLGVLLGLHNGGVRGQEGVVDSSRVAREGVDGNIRSEAEEGNEADGRSGTSSLPGAFTPAPIGTSALGLITEDGGDYLRNGPSVAVRTQRRSTSYTATTTQAAQAEHDHQLHHARRGERTRERRRHVSQPADTTEALPNRGAGNITNALSLHFDASPSTHDNYRVPVSSAYVGAGRGPEIIAPTPVFGGPNIIHLWANRA